MTEAQETFDAYLNLQLRDSSQAEVEVLEVTFGAEPLILIAPRQDPETGTFTFTIDATDAGDVQGLAGNLEIIASLLRSTSEADEIEPPA